MPIGQILPYFYDTREYRPNGAFLYELLDTLRGFQKPYVTADVRHQFLLLHVFLQRVETFRFVPDGVLDHEVPSLFRRELHVVEMFRGRYADKDGVEIGILEDFLACGCFDAELFFHLISPIGPHIPPRDVLVAVHLRMRDAPPSHRAVADNANFRHTAVLLSLKCLYAETTSLNRNGCAICFDPKYSIIRRFRSKSSGVSIER